MSITTTSSELKTCYENEGMPTLFDAGISDTFWEDVLDGFNWEWKYTDKIKEFQDVGVVKLCKLTNSMVLAEYPTIMIRDSHKEVFAEKINMKNRFESELVDEKRQIPWPAWYFERDWKYYLFLHQYLKLTNETNLKIGVVDWVIIDPTLYYEVNQESEKTTNNIDDIINGK